MAVFECSRCRNCSVFDVLYNSKTGHVVSCDGSVHVWDPESGYCLRQLELGRNFAVAVAGIPNTHLYVAATTESTLRFLDTRASSIALELVSEPLRSCRTSMSSLPVAEQRVSSATVRPTQN